MKYFMYSCISMLALCTIQFGEPTRSFQCGTFRCSYIHRKQQKGTSTVTNACDLYMQLISLQSNFKKQYLFP